MKEDGIELRVVLVDLADKCLSLEGEQECHLVFNTLEEHSLLAEPEHAVLPSRKGEETSGNVKR